MALASPATLPTSHVLRRQRAPPDHHADDADRQHGRRLQRRNRDPGARSASPATAPSPTPTSMIRPSPRNTPHFTSIQRRCTGGNPGSVTVETNGTLTGGDSALIARNYGTGALTVTANGDVTGTVDRGIYRPKLYLRHRSQRDHRRRHDGHRRAFRHSCAQLRHAARSPSPPTAMPPAPVWSPASMRAIGTPAPISA